jgi:monofunctional biosynthetic peptidoglycan transglycosylase
MAAATKSKKSWAWRICKWLLLILLAYQLWILLHIVCWIKFNPDSSALMQQRLSQMQWKRQNAVIQQRWVPYQKIANSLKRVVVAAEDAKFIEHQGFDWEGIQQAYEKNKRRGKLVAGGSTITQQLAKNLFLSTQRTPWRKLEEAMITVMLEQTMSKRRILEIYLNMIEWGDGVFGVEAAARHYFNTSASGLTAAQAARLAAMIPNPRYFDQHRASAYLNKRTATIMARMNSAQIPR